MMFMMESRGLDLPDLRYGNPLPEAKASCPPTVLSQQRCLLPKMGPIAGHYNLTCNVSFTAFTCQSIDPAAAEANAAILQASSWLSQPES
ncbi:hypothetical protein ACFLV3_06660 [Chloroflexota bacterium]